MKLRASMFIGQILRSTQGVEVMMDWLTKGGVRKPHLWVRVETVWLPLREPTAEDISRFYDIERKKKI